MGLVILLGRRYSHLQQRQESLKERFPLGKSIQAAVDTKCDGANVVIICKRIQIAFSPFLQRRF